MRISFFNVAVVAAAAAGFMAQPADALKLETQAENALECGYDMADVIEGENFLAQVEASACADAEAMAEA